MGKWNYKICNACKRPYTEKEIADRAESKKQNALKSRAKAFANGNPLKRPPLANPDDFLAAYFKGYRIKELAKIFNISESTAHRTIKRLGYKGRFKP